MEKKPNKIWSSRKLRIMQYSINYYTISTPYNKPTFLTASCLNSGYMSLYALITKDHIAMHTILF